MYRRSHTRLWGQAPAVYPFRKPFYDTPYDEDRHPMNKYARSQNTKALYPAWMDHGFDGTGRSIAIYRHHPLSRLRGSLRREKEDVPRVFKAMIQGFAHKSGKTLYTGTKVPNPSLHPYLTGEPCPVYGWKVLDHNVARSFDAPQVTADKARYKPYVALHERKIVGESAVATKGGDGSGGSGQDTTKPKKQESKPLLKRLFFWQ